jgi:hypothetical protein
LRLDNRLNVSNDTVNEIVRTEPSHNPALKMPLCDEPNVRHSLTYELD